MHKDEGFTVLGVNPGGLGGGETEDNVLDFVSQTGATFPVVWDDGGYDDFAWGPSIAPFPRDVLIARDGTVRYLATEYQAAALEGAIEAALAE